MKTVELVEIKCHSFGTLLPKTVDFADFRSLFIKAHSFFHSVFGRNPRDFGVFFWALLKMVGIRGFGHLLLKLADS